MSIDAREGKNVQANDQDTLYPHDPKAPPLAIAV